MSILIHGAEIADAAAGNRGAELMLRESASRCQSHGYAPQVLIGRVDRSLRRTMGVSRLIGGPRLRRMPPVPIPRRLSRVLALTTDANLRAVLDVSGFALGDQWGVHVATWLARKYEHWARLGVPVVLLPQAFGPFEDRDVRTAATRAVQSAAQVWARDEVSYEAVMSVVAPDAREKVRICPDITIGDSHSQLVPWDERAQRLVIIPNSNILRRTDGRAEDYLQTLEGAARWGRSQGLQVIGLLHEGARDASLLRTLQGRVDLSLVLDLDAVAVKRLIAGSRLVLSARFHGAVSALSCGVPVTVHSWSHKYRALLDDFGSAQWLADPLSTGDTIRGLVDGYESKGRAPQLQDRKAELARRVNHMWEEVWEAIE